MPGIFANGAERSGGIARGQRGELPEGLDLPCAGASHALTAVRIEGVDRPSLRDPMLASMGVTALSLSQWPAHVETRLVAVPRRPAPCSVGRP
jgi:hypothetical protein